MTRTTLPILALATGLANAASVEFTITTAADHTAPLPCRIYLLEAQSGTPHHPADAPFWNGAFISPGNSKVTVPAGTYRYTIEKGPEWNPATGTFTIANGTTQPVVERLTRLADLAAEGYFAADLHVHRNPAELPLHLHAEDLHIASVQTWWNETNPWKRTPPPPEPVNTTPDGRSYHLLSGEDERGGGALLYHRVTTPLDITGSDREFPSSLTFLQQAATDGLWIDIEKPFWWDTPIWLATGKIDSIGIAHNHMQRAGILPGEAWGRPRDATKYPGPHGNGLYTQDLYYKILNTGLRLPPTAGSASGVLKNPVGHNRVYVHTGTAAPPAWDTWWQNLRAGHCFVTNGPLLRLTANGSHPGTTLKSTRPLPITIDGTLTSQEKIAALELVQNGTITPFTLGETITIKQSGWFLIRAIADVPHTFQFASTSPWHVEIDNHPMPPDPAACQFFATWCQQRHARVTSALTDPKKRAAALPPIEAATKFWESRAP